MLIRYSAIAKITILFLIVSACQTPASTAIPEVPTKTPLVSTDVETPPPTAAIMPTPANTPVAEGDLAPVEITFINNAGFLIAAGDTKVLIVCKLAQTRWNVFAR